MIKDFAIPFKLHELANHHLNSESMNFPKQMFENEVAVSFRCPVQRPNGYYYTEK